MAQLPYADLLDLNLKAAITRARDCVAEVVTINPEPKIDGIGANPAAATTAEVAYADLGQELEVINIAINQIKGLVEELLMAVPLLTATPNPYTVVINNNNATAEVLSFEREAKKWGKWMKRYDVRSKNLMTAAMAAGRRRTSTRTRSQSPLPGADLPKPQIKRPEPFLGKREDYKRFITEFDLYLGNPTVKKTQKMIELQGLIKWPM